MRTLTLPCVTVLVICFPVTAQNGLYVRYEVETTTSERFLEESSIVRELEEVFWGPEQLVVINDHAQLIVDHTLGTLTVADREYSTFYETKTPFDPLSVLNAVSALRFMNTDRAECVLTSSGETAKVLDREVVRYDLGDSTDPSRYGSMWFATHFPEAHELPTEPASALWSLRFPNCAGHGLDQLDELDGIPLKWSRKHSTDAHAVTVEKTAIEAGVRPFLPSRLELENGFVEKSKITYADLVSVRAGPPTTQYTAEEQLVRSVIARFRDGCIARDTSKLDEWVEDLLTDDVYIVGTDSRWPGTWEWRGGKNAARQMFTRDWLYWGDVRIYDEEMHIDVEGSSAWVIGYATVTRRGSDDDRSRRGSIARIARYTTEDWSSRRILYEAIADASQVLAQYERSNDFVTPMRTQFDLVKRDGKWLIKVIHWSHPANGFRSWRILNTESPYQSWH